MRLLLPAARLSDPASFLACYRDLKPENIFFTADDELKLGDFGLAIDYSLDKPISRVGTLDYMAPEVLKMKNPDELTEEELENIQGAYRC